MRISPQNRIYIVELQLSRARIPHRPDLSHSLYNLMEFAPLQVELKLSTAEEHFQSMRNFLQTDRVYPVIATMRSAKVDVIYNQASSASNRSPRQLLFSYNVTWKLVEVAGQYGDHFSSCYLVTMVVRRDHHLPILFNR